MKKVFTLLSILIITITASAQRWNSNLGIGIANWTGDNTSGADFKVSCKLGISLELPFNNTWSLQTGINLVSKGTKVNGKISGYNTGITINQIYLESPIMAGVRIQTVNDFDILFKAGPYLAYGIGGKTKVEIRDEKASANTFGKDGLNRFDAGLGGGIIFEFGTIDIGLEASRGLIKISDGVQAYNSVIQLTTALKF